MLGCVPDATWQCRQRDTASSSSTPCVGTAAEHTSTRDSQDSPQQNAAASNLHQSELSRLHLLSAERNRHFWGITPLLLR